MFDSIDDRMKQDAKDASSAKERMMVWLGVALLSIVLFGGLYLSVRSA
jgi:hypothetical protein